MEPVLRAVAIYVVLLIIFRISGKRSLAQITTFDFVLLMVIGEATQQAMVGKDFSMTNFALLTLTLVGIDIGLSLIKQRFEPVEKWLDSAPVVLVENGKLLTDRMEKARVDAADILTKARELQGLERIEQIKYAVLESSGGITIIPKEK